MLRSIGMRLRGTNPARVAEAMRMSDELRLQLSEYEVEAHLLAGGDAVAVVRAMAVARERGMPENFAGICEAQLAGLDLHRFVEQDYADPELKTWSALRGAAATDAAAAGRLAKRLERRIADLSAKRAAGPQSLSQRFAWKMLDQGFQQAKQEAVRELATLVPRLATPAAAEARKVLEENETRRSPRSNDGD